MFIKAELLLKRAFVHIYMHARVPYAYTGALHWKKSNIILESNLQNKLVLADEGLTTGFKLRTFKSIQFT